MKTMNITVDGKLVALRLTASKLAAYAAEVDAGHNTLFAVMDALDDVTRQGQLLTAALTYKGHANHVTDGFDLIDLLADEGYDPIQIKELILDLAVDSGVVGRDDAAKLKIAVRAGSDKLYTAAISVLSGDLQGVPKAAKSDDAETDENPI